jgi:subtilisin family serine protease
MKKVIYLFLVLLFAACGNSRTASLSSDGANQSAALKITAQSILATMEKGKYKEGELLVKFRSGVLTAQSLKTHQSLGSSVARRFSIVPHLEHVKLPAGLSVKDAIVKYMADPNVEYAEPNYIRCASSIPNDTDFSQQWALLNTGQFAGGTAGADIEAPQAWNVSTGLDAVTVAVLDTGIDYNHLDLVNNIWTNPGESCTDGNDHDGNGFFNDCRGWDFVNSDNDPMDDNGHGTHVAGIIGAVGDNGLGTAGVMWHVKLMPLKILNAFGFSQGSCSGPSGFVADEIAAIQYAVAKGAKIINASYHSAGFCNAEFDAIDAANTAHVLFVAAAGNGGLDTMGINNDLDPQYPASYNLPNIISVAATDQNDSLASFSNFGPNSVHVAAPGVYVLSTVPYAGIDLSFQSLCTGSFFAGYDFCAGTSMATPHVSGLAGLLYSYYDGIHNTQFNHSQVRSTILRYVDTDADSPNLQTLRNRIQTSGRINAFRALSSLLAPTDLTATADSPSQITLTWKDNATGEDGYRVARKGPTDADFVDITAGAPLPPNTTKFTDPGVSPTTTYEYKVTAFNNIADSFASNTVSVTTPDNPPPSSGGGGGCSVGARQNPPTAVADFVVLLTPLLFMALLRRKR